jgi:protein SCO1/2
METSASTVSSTTPKAVNLKWLIVAGLLLVVLIGVMTYILARSLRPYEFKGTVLNPPVPAVDFTMTSSQTGQPISLSDFRDKLVFIYFGYASCPDVCPTSLSHYTQTYHLLSEEEQEDVQLLWVTVDPERDTRDVMEDYISHFEPAFMLGLIPPDPATLAEVASNFAIYYEKVDSGSETEYLMDHTASLILVDTAGNWSMIYPFGTPPEDIAADIKYLVKNNLQVK